MKKQKNTMDRLKQWIAWLNNQETIFSMWCVQHGKKGNILFLFVLFGTLALFAVLCMAVISLPVYLLFAAKGVSTHLAWAGAIIASCVLVVIGGVCGYMAPVKLSRRRCVTCGMLAHLFCWKGPCAPGTWYCDYHYIRLHVPPEEQDALIALLAGDKES